MRQQVLGRAGPSALDHSMRCTWTRGASRARVVDAHVHHGGQGLHWGAGRAASELPAAQVGARASSKAGPAGAAPQCHAPPRPLEPAQSLVPSPLRSVLARGGALESIACWAGPPGPWRIGDHLDRVHGVLAGHRLALWSQCACGQGPGRPSPGPEPPAPPPAPPAGTWQSDP